MVREFRGRDLRPLQMAENPPPNLPLISSSFILLPSSFLRSPPMKTFWLLLVVLGCAVAAANAAGPHPSLPRPVIPECLGVNLRAGEMKPGELDLLAAAGFRWVRMDLMWAATERSKGQYDFSAYDRLVAQLTRRKLRAVFVLGYGNPLYAEPGEAPPFTSRSGTPEFREAFAAWAVAAVAHCRGGGCLWEMWSEPNRQGFANTDSYIALASATGGALRAAGLLGPRGEGFIGPATARIDLPFLEACFRGGLLEYWDGVSVHPSHENAPETVEEELRRVRLLVGQYAPAGKTVPVISSAGGYSSDAPALGANSRARGETQATYLARHFLTNIANDVALSIWADWRDDATQREGERGCGLVENTGSGGPAIETKPAYAAVKTLQEQFGGFRFNKRLFSWNSDEDYMLLFERLEEVRTAVWTVRAVPEIIGIPASYGAHTLFATDGDCVRGAQAERRTVFGLKFIPSAAPLYVCFPPGNALLLMATSATRLPLEYHYNMPGAAPAVRFRFKNYAPHAIKVRLTSDDEKRVNEKWAILDGKTDTKEVVAGDYFNLPIAALSRAQASEKSALMLGIEVVPLGVTDDDELISIAQKVKLITANPLTVTRMPGKPDEIVVKFENTSGAVWKGPIVAVGQPEIDTPENRGGGGGWGGWGGGGFGGGGSGDGGLAILGFGQAPAPRPARRDPANKLKVPVLTEPLDFEVPLGSAMSVARIPIKTREGDPWWRGIRAVSLVGAKGVRGDFLITDDRFFELDPNGVQVVPDGDPKVKVRHSREPAEPPDGPLMKGLPALRVGYDFDEGWKSLRVINPTWPPPSEKNLIGQPHEFGIWIYGDSRGCVAHMRFIDSTNQFFQTIGVPVDWTGWRHVKFPMEYRPGKKLENWSGAGDGDIHYPIDLDSVLVLDNASRQRLKGEIYICGPSLIY